MTKDILESLRQQRLKTIQQRERYQDLVESRVEQHANALKHVDFTDGRDPADARELHAQKVFYRLQDEYRRTKTVTLPTQQTKQQAAFWRRVVAAADEVGVPVEVYLRAQMQYFHDTFRKAPELKHLLTENAKLRAREVKVSARKIIGNNIVDKQDLSQLFISTNKYLLDIQRAQGLSREEVYRQLVRPGHLHIPEAFLQADPLWKKVVNE